MPDGDKVEIMKKVKKFRERSQIPTKWAEELSESLHKTHTQVAINKLYDNVVQEELEM